MCDARELDVNLYPKADAVVALGVVREDSTFEKQVGVVQRRDSSTRLAELVDAEDQLVGRLGILGLPLTDEVAERFSGPMRGKSAFSPMSSVTGACTTSCVR